MSSDSDSAGLLDLFTPPEADVDPTEQQHKLGRRKNRYANRLRANETLARLAVKALLSPALTGRIRRRETLCLMVQVPSADWTRPVVDALRALGTWDIVHEGEANVRNRGKKDEAITSCLSGGGRVFGVSHSPDTQLPLPILGAADVRLTVTLNDDRIVSDVILAATGRRPTKLPAGIARSLTHSEICAAVRIGSTSKQCVERLAATASTRNSTASLDDVPLLSDLAGYGDAMTWCTDLLADLDAWRRGEAPFPTAARAVFAGPPGGGKTTLVRSLARTGKLALVATSVGEWFADTPGNLDSVVKQIADVFAAAQAASPAILFLDELDAVPNRATMSSRGKDWWLPVIGYLLTTLDGASSRAARDLIIIGATNYGNDLDAALVRPGRLERIITIETPDDPDTRVKILRTHLADDLRDEDLSLVGKLTAQATGADLAGLVRRSRRDARAAGRKLALSDLMALVMPHEDRDAKTLRRTAVHEAGHVVVSLAMGVAVRSVSVVRNQMSGGQMSGDPVLTGLPVRSDLETFAIVSLGGTAAEQVIFGERSVGAGGALESDLARTTGILTMLRTSFGLGDDLSFRSPPDEAVRLLESDIALRKDVETDVRRLFSRACRLVALNVAATQVIAATLQARRFMTAADIASILESANLKIVSGEMVETTPCDP